MQLAPCYDAIWIFDKVFEQFICGASQLYFTAVADNSPIPVLLYNVPKFTHINMSFKLVAELSGHPNIVGIKDSTGNVIQLGEFANHVTGDFNLLVGRKVRDDDVADAE